MLMGQTLQVSLPLPAEAGLVDCELHARESASLRVAMATHYGQCPQTVLSRALPDPSQPTVKVAHAGSRDGVEYDVVPPSVTVGAGRRAVGAQAILVDEPLAARVAMATPPPPLPDEPSCLDKGLRTEPPSVFQQRSSATVGVLHQHATQPKTTEPNDDGMLRLLVQLVQQVDALSSKVDEQQATINHLNQQLQAAGSASECVAPSSTTRIPPTSPPFSSSVGGCGANSEQIEAHARYARGSTDKALHAAPLVVAEEEYPSEDDCPGDRGDNETDRDSMCGDVGEAQARPLGPGAGNSSSTEDEARLTLDADPFADIPRIVYVPDADDQLDQDPQGDMHEMALLPADGPENDNDDCNMSPLLVPVVDDMAGPR